MLRVYTGMMYYQAAPPANNYYNSFGQHPYHQAMLVHYNQQPSYWSRSSIPATNVAAFIAGSDTYRTGSYLQSEYFIHKQCEIKMK